MGNLRPKPPLGREVKVGTDSGNGSSPFPQSQDAGHKTGTHDEAKTTFCEHSLAEAHSRLHEAIFENTRQDRQRLIEPSGWERQRVTSDLSQDCQLPMA